MKHLKILFLLLGIISCKHPNSEKDNRYQSAKKMVWKDDYIENISENSYTEEEFFTNEFEKSSYFSDSDEIILPMEQEDGVKYI